MGFFSWLGFETRSQTADPAGSVGSAGGDSPLPGVMPPTRQPATNVSLDRALTVPATYRAISILATAASQLEIGAWKAGREVTPSPSLIRRPDVNETPAAFVKRTVIGLAGTGNAFWRVYRNADSTVANVQALNPLGITISHDQYGRRRYSYADPYAGPQEFTAAQIKHLRLLEVPGQIMGLGPVQACRSALAGAMDLRDYADNWFSEAAIPTGVLSSNMQLNPGQADEMKRRWHETQATRDVAVLGYGLEYKPIILNPSDAQFLESQQFSVTDIARIFGIPAAYLLAEVNGSSMTYQSLEMADTQFLRYTLMQYLSEIEGALTDLLVRGQVAKFKVGGLLRPDAKTRAEIQQIYAQMGVMTVNEIRADEGLAPIAGGDQPPAPAEPADQPAVEPAPDQQEITSGNA